jgi:hypothetical protein
MASAISFDNSGGVAASLSPTKTNVGHLMFGSSGRESRRAMIARCWRMKPSVPTSSAMSSTILRNASPR